MPLLPDLRRFFGRSPKATAIDGSAPALPPGEADSGAALRLAAEEIVAELRRERDALAALGEALAPLPRIAEGVGDVRRHAVVIHETFAQHADRSQRSSEAMSGLLERVGDSLVGQAETVGQMHEQVNLVVRTVGTLGDDLDRLRSSLTDIAEHSARASTTLSQLAERQIEREERLIGEMQSWRAWSIGLLAVVAAGMIVAATALVIVLAR
ncbi:MAG TPA: hypothetical protein PKC43_08595 [Phycisphaerales bacterium]|nr:hypothetical protein [Phycisphaerales bacterium]HMP37493.1 hypothetical protein [Phycisphaerales bacterium]